MKLNLIKTVYCLFFFPAVFRELKTLKWWKGVVSLLLVTIAMSVMVFAIKMPSQLQTVSGWTEWFAEQVPEIGLTEEGTLELKTAKQVPFTASRGSFLLIVRKNGDEPKSEQMDSPSGVWISPVQVLAWSTQVGERYMQPLVKDGMILDYFELKDVFAGNSKLSIEDYRSWSASFVTFSFIGTLLSRIMTMGLYLLALVTMHKFIGSPVFTGLSFGRVMGLYCYASIPAMIFAVIYSSLPVQILDFSTAYLFSLLFYMFFVAGRYLIPKELLQGKKEENGE